MGAAAAAARRERPELQELTRSRTAWAAVALVAVAVLLWAALSRHVYHLTTPWELGRERVFELRKLYSVVAFALAGIVADRALPPARRPALRAAFVVAAFSALIEVAQKLRHAHESLGSNLVDVLCGALGGWLGVTLLRALLQPERREQRR